MYNVRRVRDVAEGAVLLAIFEDTTLSEEV